MLNASQVVPMVPQDRSNACWLASSTMMRSWRDLTNYSLSDTLLYLDASDDTFANFTNIYNNDDGLSFSSTQTIIKILGIKGLSPASYSINYISSLLQNSPIMAIIMFSSSSIVAHMVVITGVKGDGTPSGTTLQINDPLPLNAGHIYDIAFTDFLNKFEAVVTYELGFDSNVDLISQLFYYKF